MHFPIIEITSSRENLGIGLNYEDETLNYFTDYYGEEYSKSERAECIKRLVDFFEGLGTVVTSRGEIYLNNEETIRKNLLEYHKSVLEQLNKDADDYEGPIWRRFFHFREAGKNYKDYDTLLFFDGCGYTSMQFIEDLLFHAGKTLYIGKIYDAHY